MRELKMYSDKNRLIYHIKLIFRLHDATYRANIVLRNRITYSKFLIMNSTYETDMTGVYIEILFMTNVYVLTTYFKSEQLKKSNL